MLIQPDTNIRLIRNCPLNNKYEHTIYFETVEEQIAYFKSLPGKPFTKQSYQRYASGVLTVQVLADEIYDCNYLMFQNAGFGLKWFYAFITKVEYVNNITSKVYYELDVMQTWHFDYDTKQCFVVREHSKTDEIGDNLVHENIYFGDYVYSGKASLTGENGLNMGHMVLVIMYNPTLIDFVDIAGEISGLTIYKGNVYGGIYQGLNFIVGHLTAENITALENYLMSADILSSGGIINCFLFPEMFLPKNVSGYNEYNTSKTLSVVQNTDFQGYIPKNKKLFTYPYSCAYLTAKRGQGNDFAFERFYNPDKVIRANFKVCANFCSNPSAMAFPLDYKGVTNYIEGAVTIPSYPVCTWGTNGLTEWLNNNLFSTAIGIIGAAVGGAISPSSTIVPQMTGASKSTVIGGSIEPDLAMRAEYGSQKATPEAVQGLTGAVSSVFQQGDIHGSASGDILFGTEGGREICAYSKHITREYAEIVDNYFTKFGYATNRVKKPNRHVRKSFTYVKTLGCEVEGGAPADDLRAICSIYDSGITFWDKGAEIGKYFPYDNAPLEV